MRCFANVRKLLFGISPVETTFRKRGFHSANDHVRLRLETIGETFVHGYQTALMTDTVESAACQLDLIEPDFRGFAYEGASMALSILDAVTPWKTSRFQSWIVGPGSSHAYMVHVGAGWAAARLPWVRRKLPMNLDRYDGVLRWLVVDGFGFHEGYFHSQKYVRRLSQPKSFEGYARRAFDQGLGRSLWFVCGADVRRIENTVRGFPGPRHADLWSGLGLACTYAGGMDRDAMEVLCQVAGPCRPHLAQGSVFAAAARSRAGITTNHTQLACEMICEMTADEAALLATNAEEGLPLDGELPAYEHWRSRIRNRFAASRTCIASGQLSNTHQVKPGHTEVARDVIGGKP
jgi:hypothetical protein